MRSALAVKKFTSIDNGTKVFAVSRPLSCFSAETVCKKQRLLYSIYSFGKTNLTMQVSSLPKPQWLQIDKRRAGAGGCRSSSRP